ncbi:SMR family transporter [Cohnella sp. WQ 127256]|uniref:SMR family transporter n=1 Tax=Cohnella sp. WQ 127256 TaxID=2938790 RepID=UPI002119AB0F
MAIKWGTLGVTQEGLGAKELLMKYFTNVSVLLGLCLYALSSVTWIFAVAKVDLSKAYPMVAVGYVLVFICSYFLFNEPISTIKIAGLITIVAGVIMISQS